MKAKAYAKINLAIKVLGVREDGYHELEMVMENINLYDKLTFSKSDKIHVRTSEYVCEEQDNIVYKAAHLIKQKYNVNEGIDIYIKKNIPSNAGLGGGSSDAACTIWVLNKMWKLNMKMEDMASIANALGSDVLFFLYNSLSLIKGRGDIIIPINKYFEEKAILIKPKLSVSTKKVYEMCDNTVNDKEVSKLIENIESENAYDYMFNDLEDACMKAYPEYNLQEIKQHMALYGAKKVMMSGSGSSIIVFVNDYKAFKFVKSDYPEYDIFKIKTISYCARF